MIPPIINPLYYLCLNIYITFMDLHHKWIEILHRKFKQVIYESKKIVQ